MKYVISYAVQLYVWYKHLLSSSYVRSN